MDRGAYSRKLLCVDCCQVDLQIYTHPHVHARDPGSGYAHSLALDGGLKQRSLTRPWVRLSAKRHKGGRSEGATGTSDAHHHCDQTPLIKRGILVREPGCYSRRYVAPTD
ncbi:hypothetical protein PoB_003298000 [Plakobranchus ocellatus]|uniref:Uncharacterized protein n=1 Tax=Plakobranchus ocellatus TaxID=259542 RepID=A0AAV4AE82_9GAST|nr:hypothetical protein PoB_003298000 [Plakobranchus ocellatus]